MTTTKPCPLDESFVAKYLAIFFNSFEDSLVYTIHFVDASQLKSLVVKSEPCGDNCNISYCMYPY